jgi:hypothetical protein
MPRSQVLGRTAASTTPITRLRARGGGDQKSKTHPTETDRLTKFLRARVLEGGVYPPDGPALNFNLHQIANLRPEELNDDRNPWAVAKTGGPSFA